jgi:hypothetical protein
MTSTIVFSAIRSTVNAARNLKLDECRELIGLYVSAREALAKVRPGHPFCIRQIL